MVWGPSPELMATPAFPLPVCAGPRPSRASVEPLSMVPGVAGLGHGGMSPALLCSLFSVGGTMIWGPHLLVKSEGLGQPQPQGGEQHALCSSSGKQAQIPPTEC